MAVHATAIEGKDVKPGRGLVTRQQIDVALLAQLVRTTSQ